jgi:hypothetical protein
MAISIHQSERKQHSHQPLAQPMTLFLGLRQYGTPLPQNSKYKITLTKLAWLNQTSKKLY